MRSPTNETADGLNGPAPLPAREGPGAGASVERELLLVGGCADDSEGSPSASPPTPDPALGKQSPGLFQVSAGR